MTSSLQVAWIILSPTSPHRYDVVYLHTGNWLSKALNALFCDPA
jgi:hypothetical protein